MVMMVMMISREEEADFTREKRAKESREERGTKL